MSTPSLHRRIFIGRTPKFANLYLGNDSAQAAAYLYGKSGIEFTLVPTDIFIAEHDKVFNYLYTIGATSLKNDTDESNESIIDDVKVLMEAYDVMQERCCVNIDMKNMMTEECAADRVLYNINYMVSIALPYNEIPPEYKNSILSCSEWYIKEEYEVGSLKNISFERSEALEVL